MNKNKINKFLEKAIDKMFQAVGFECWDREFTKQDQWYSKKTWSKQQSDEYEKWFLTEIKKDLKLNKHLAQKEWNYFNLMWGWKLDEQR